jgi:hypothetical protein
MQSWLQIIILPPRKRILATDTGLAIVADLCVNDECSDFIAGRLLN